MKSQKFKEHMVNMLTLRYDPMEPPTIPPLKYKAWFPNLYETTALSLERKLMSAIMVLEPFKKIAIGLSSGIDSVLLLCIIRHLFPEKKIVAIHYIGINDELEDAKEYAKIYGAEFVTINKDTILDTIDWQVTITKDMTWDGFDYLLYQTAKRLGCDILVDGTGADELLGGYTFRYNSFDHSAGSIERKAYSYLDCHNRDWVDDQAHLFGKEVKFDWKMVIEHIQPHFANPLPTIQQIFHADYNGKLCHLFTKKQEIFAKLYQLPSYSPYLTDEIIKYGSHLDSHIKIMGVVGKLPLRQIAARQDLAVTPKKLGFSHDTVREWNGEHWEEAHNDITDPNNLMFKDGLISFDWVKRHTMNQKDRYNVRYVNKFFQLMALEDHLRHLDRE